MRRLVNYLINNIREHFMLYIVLWSLLAIIDVIYIVFFGTFSLTFIDTPLNYIFKKRRLKFIERSD